jgi:hypothetical protein
LEALVEELARGHSCNTGRFEPKDKQRYKESVHKALKALQEALQHEKELEEPGNRPKRART